MKAAFEKSVSLRGEIKVPGDKSISHRGAILGALACGTSVITGYSPASDCASTLKVLEKLGVELRREGDTLLVDGRAGVGFLDPAGPLDAGNSGTTMRLLAGVLASLPLSATITGDPSLLHRPMGRIIEPLSLMGARLSASDEEGHPPLRVTGGGLKGIHYSPPVASAQVKSAVLLAGLGASGKTAVAEIVLTRDHTERLLKRACIDVTTEGLTVLLEPGVPRALEIDVPGDFSSAAFLIAAGALCRGSEIEVRSVGLNPTRTGFLGLLCRMGADIKVLPDEDDSWEPRGTIRVKCAPLKGIRLSPKDVALAIDEVTLVALLATQAHGRTEIRGASELRHKESDRLAGTVSALRALGARIEETAEGMAVDGPSVLRGAAVSAGGDHRLAMMLAIAGLVADGRTLVDGWEWTRVSYPGFEEALEVLGARTG